VSFILHVHNSCEQELLAKLESTEAKLAQTELDLKSEQNVRRTLQSEAAEAKGREEALVQKQVCDLFGRLENTDTNAL